MDLFGLKEHDARHDDVERQLRRLIEQVAQLSIHLGATRAELQAVASQLGGKVDAGDIAPDLQELNQAVKDARVKLDAAESAAEESWDAANVELAGAVDRLRAKFNEPV